LGALLVDVVVVLDDTNQVMQVSDDDDDDGDVNERVVASNCSKIN
jgi:hypothetical protein